MADKTERSENYSQGIYSRRQIRDAVQGSDRVKRSNQLYLPMPGGMAVFEQGHSERQFNRTGDDYVLTETPWYHPNKAYSAYLMRARFPDITANILRGLVGIAKKGDIEYKLPPRLDAMMESITPKGNSLDELYYKSIEEVMQVGKFCYVLDVLEDSTFNIVTYASEANINWEYGVRDGKKILTSVVFLESSPSDEHEMCIEYKLVNNIAVYQRYIDGEEFEEEEVLMLQGKTLDALPVFFASVEDNTAENGVMPMLGVSDIALTMFRKDADLSNAQHLTCSPTLILTGVSDDQTPSFIGSSVVVSFTNPDAKAFYTETDTSALDHMQKAINDLREEATGVGAQMLSTGKSSAESAEALSMRQEASSAGLMDVVGMVKSAIGDLLQFASDWGNFGDVDFSPCTDFAEHTLEPTELNALVSSWVSGAISHDTLLDNLRESGIVSKATTNEKEKSSILLDQENSLMGVDDTPVNDEGDNE